MSVESTRPQEVLLIKQDPGNKAGVMTDELYESINDTVKHTLRYRKKV